MKKLLFSTLAIFIVWSVLDFFVHGVFLKGLYEQTSNLWRPMEDIQANWWMHLITLASAFIFSWLWCCHTKDSRKNLQRGLGFGAKIGLLFGLSMGFGMYGVLPIPLSLGFSWFISDFVNFLIAGGIAAAIIKECNCPSNQEA